MLLWGKRPGGRVARTWGLVPDMGMDCKRDSAAGAERGKRKIQSEKHCRGKGQSSGLVCPEGLRLSLSVSSGVLSRRVT